MAGRFGSVITAMVTPFRDDHARRPRPCAGARLAGWSANGSDAVVVAGSTGESPTLTHEEKADLFRAVGEAIRGQGKLICGTGTYSTAETLELTQAAEDAGADGLLVVTPYYNKPPQRGLDRALRARRRCHRAADHRVQHPRPHGDADRARHAAASRRATEHRRGEGLDRRLPGRLAADRGGAGRLRGLLGRRLGDVRLRLPGRRRAS